jgi:hypothetical protein
MRHDLHLQSEPFESVNLRLQRAIFTSTDVEFGDLLMIREYDQETGRFSGRWVEASVTHIMRHPHSCLVSFEVRSAGVAKPYFLNVSGSRQAA